MTMKEASNVICLWINCWIYHLFFNMGNMGPTVKFYNRLSILQIFGILAFVYFGTHFIVGYLHCEYSDYADCPGYISADEEDEVTDNK